MMDWGQLILRVGGGLAIYGIFGLAIALLIKVIGKRDRLPRWPIYAALVFYVVTTVIGAYVLSEALESEMANSN